MFRHIINPGGNIGQWNQFFDCDGIVSLCWAKTGNVRGYIMGGPMPIRGVVQNARIVCGLTVKQSTNYVTCMQEANDN